MGGEGWARSPGDQSSLKSAVAGRWQNRHHRDEERDASVPRSVIAQSGSAGAKFLTPEVGEASDVKSIKASFKQIKCSNWFE